jgi:hypothetical protein
VAARKNMARCLQRWLAAHRRRPIVEEPLRGYLKPEPIDEEQVRQQALEGRKLIKEQWR